MASAATAAGPRSARSFATLLEDYAAPKAKFPPARDLDGLEDDVATLTYEHALRAQTRFRRTPELDAVESCATAKTDDPAPLPSQQRLDFAENVYGATAKPGKGVASAPVPFVRKSASVTLRLTAVEDEQLRGRAVEAGLTLSAYLRFCAFEVDSLRAQVKEAVAQMRQAEQGERVSFWQRLRRLGRRTRGPE